MTPDELKDTLRNFTGTTKYTRWSIFPHIVLTDGALFLAENANAFWLMDAIASHIDDFEGEGFVVATLSQLVSGRWELAFDDGNGKLLAEQRIEHSDFPLDEITLYAVWQGDLWVILLPSEW